MALQQPVNKLQIRKTTWNEGGFVDMNSLSNALMTKPYMATAITQLLGSKYMMPFLTTGLGRVASKPTLIPHEKFQWAIMGNVKQPISIVGMVYPVDGSGDAEFAGKGNSQFVVKLERRYFDLGDVVRFEDGQHCRVQEDPQYDDGVYRYTFKLISDDPTAYIAATALEAGKQVTFVTTAFEEYSEGGSTKEPSPIYFENIPTIHRKSFGVTGSAMTEAAAFDFTIDGQKLTYYCRWQEWLAMQSFMTEIDYWLMYGQKNEMSDGRIALEGKNGRPVKSGSGLLEQIAYTNSSTYTRLSEEFLLEYVLHLQLQAQAAENSHLIMMTGAGGMKEFNRAMRDKVVVSSNNTADYLMTKTGNSVTFNPNRFKTYEGILGTTITVVHNPMMDDPNTFPERDPESGLPKESYRMVFLDFGDYQGESNISVYSKGGDGKDRTFVMGYEVGMHTPPGMKESETVFRSSGLDGYKCHMLAERMLIVKNPYSCGQLKRAYA
jgi:hypothetical protein